MNQQFSVLLLSESASSNLIGLCMHHVRDNGHQCLLLPDPTPEEITGRHIEQAPGMFILLPCEQKYAVFESLQLRFPDVPVLVIGQDRPEEYVPYLSAGAAGFLFHREISVQLAGSIDRIRREGMLVNRYLKETLLDGRHSLSHSHPQIAEALTAGSAGEKKLLRLMQRHPGIAYGQAASRLRLSPDTVRKRMQQIMHRACIRNRIELQHYLSRLEGINGSMA